MNDPTPAPPLRLISSMATRALLVDLASAWQATHPGQALTIESVGGVDAARRVAAGEALDGVVLAADALDTLIAAGHVLGAGVGLVRSEVAVAVRAGAPQPAIDSESALRQAVRAAGSIGYSTGPSGSQLLQLFARWGLADELQARLVQAPAGIAVGQLVAQGQVELGFQQLSELMTLAGIAVLGTLPEAVRITTVFAAGVAATSTRPDAVRALLACWAEPGATAIKQRHGMQAA